MKKGIFLFLMLLVVGLALPLAAQTTPVEIDPMAVDTILAGGILGLGVIAVTQVVKNALKVNGVPVYFISLLVSAGATIIWTITGGGGFTLTKFIGYTVIVWAVANGWYKFKTA